MKKPLFIMAFILSVACVAALGWHYLHRQPDVSCDDKGCNFSYQLCIPSSPPYSCEKTVNIIVPFGQNAARMPYTHRMKPVITVEDARKEAEKIAAIAEDKWKPDADDLASMDYEKHPHPLADNKTDEKPSESN